MNNAAIIFRINKSYCLYEKKPGIPKQEIIYQCTRGVWIVGKRREKVKYAFGLYEERIIGAFKIKGWQQVKLTSDGIPKGYELRNFNKEGAVLSEKEAYSNWQDRWEFDGNSLSGKILQNCQKYLSEYEFIKAFSNGKSYANPVRYVYVNDECTEIAPANKQ